LNSSMVTERSMRPVAHADDVGGDVASLGGRESPRLE
jgi:hypothetical protein